MAKPQNLIHSVATSSPVVRIVQLTDTHLCESNGGTLLGMDTDHSLQAVIDQAQREHPQVDVVLGTGDLSDHGYRAAYERLQGYFCRFECDSFWLPGNHDNRKSMEQAAVDPVRMVGELRAGDWQILMLDSQVPGEVGGRLGSAQLDLLERALSRAQNEDLYSLVCLHHQPIEIGSVWLDEQMVSDAEALFAVLDRFSAVRGVLWGHVHQEIEQVRKEVKLMASPSTCVQFAPGSEKFRADDLPPGYRWLELHPDGRIETSVYRVWDVKFNVELGSSGYL